MNRIADRGLRIVDSETQMDAPLQQAVNGSAPSIGAVTSGNPQSAIRNSQSVELHIEELVLDGFAPANRYAIRDKIERELTRLFSEEGAPTAITQDGEIAQLDRGAFEISGAYNSETIGMQLAKAIYGALGK
jgi:hypothetical protein